MTLHCCHSNNNFFFFNDPAPTEIYTLSLHDALPIYGLDGEGHARLELEPGAGLAVVQHLRVLVIDTPDAMAAVLAHQDRKSTRLNSSHGYISYAVFCLKKKKHYTRERRPRRNAVRSR